MVFFYNVDTFEREKKSLGGRAKKSPISPYLKIIELHLSAT